MAGYKSNEGEMKTVCRADIDRATYYPSDLHRGERVYFCNEACLRAFQSQPDAFIAGDIEHPSEEDQA
jgi:YHS domain-containing protein